MDVPGERNPPPDLAALGWDERWAEAFRAGAGEGYIPARVAVQHRERYILLTGEGEVAARVTGRFRHEVDGPGDFPVVGDWVAATVRPDERAADIHAVVPRRTVFARQAAGEATSRQVLAANLDVVLIVSGLDDDFNPRRLERYRLMTEAGGAEPIFVLNKMDLCRDLPAHLSATDAVAGGRRVLVMSALMGEGVEEVRRVIPAGRTGALLGSSGVGKSTLINRLLGREQVATGAVRADDSRGRHVTTRRELHRIPDVGLLIDTPGLREVQLWSEGISAEQAFDEIAALAGECRFADCTHEHEPGCAVLAAVERGEISRERLESYYKLRKELAWQARREDPIAREAEGKRIARLQKEVKRLMRKRRE